jgi:hypothetical protein
MNTLKRLFQKYKTLIKGITTGFAIILIYDWLIAPGLTAKNTIINIISFVGGSVLILFVGLLIWENLFKTEKIWKIITQENNEKSKNTDNVENEKKNQEEEDLKN